MSAGRWPRVDADALPWISTDQMVEVDRVMIDDLHIELVQMMENAGRNLAQLTIGLFAPSSATVYVGPGGNGGGGLVAARHLANMGVRVAVALARDRSDFAGVPAHQLDIVDRMGIPIGYEVRTDDVVVDAVIGYSLRGAPHGRSAEFIEAMATRPNVVSLDVPSGLDTATGETPGAAVEATATLTLAMPKVGLRASPNVGRLFVGDISVPPSVYRDMGGLPPEGLFRDGPVVEIV